MGGQWRAKNFAATAVWRAILLVPRPHRCPRAAHLRLIESGGSSVTTVATRIVLMIATPRGRSTPMPPQFTPPRNPGNSIVPSRLGGVNSPSDAQRADAALAPRAVDRREPPRIARDAGRGERRRVWMERAASADACSPATSLRGTARSTTGNTGTPVLRSSTKTSPVFDACMTTGIAMPLRITVVQHRLRGSIVVPQIVMHELEAPHELFRSSRAAPRSSLRSRSVPAACHRSDRGSDFLWE